jgi:hypothetical protein
MLHFLLRDDSPVAKTVRLVLLYPWLLVAPLSSLVFLFAAMLSPPHLPCNAWSDIVRQLWAVVGWLCTLFYMFYIAKQCTTPTTLSRFAYHGVVVCTYLLAGTAEAFLYTTLGGGADYQHRCLPADSTRHRAPLYLFLLTCELLVAQWTILALFVWSLPPPPPGNNRRRVG